MSTSTPDAAFASPTGTPALARTARRFAGLMPGVIISYSALVDPLINMDVPQGEYFGGVALEAGVKSNALTQLVMPLFFGLALVCALVARPVVPSLLRRAVWPAVALLALACMSVLWSRAPAVSFNLAVYQSILFVSLLLFVAVAADPPRVLRFVLLAFGIAIAANVVAVFVRTGSPIGHQGIYGFKNTSGSVAACAFLFALFHVREPRLLWRATAWFTLPGALFVGFASDSKTAVALMFAGPALAVALHLTTITFRMRTALSFLLLSTLLAGLVAVALGVLGGDTDDLLNATYGDTTFTGRTEIWDFMARHIAAEFWLGNGYRGFWSLTGSPQHGSEIEFIRTIGSGHSGYMDIRLDLGVIGLALLAIFIATAFVTAGRTDLRPARRTLLYLSIVIFAAGRNAMESVILWSTFFDNLAFLTVVFLACYREQPLERVLADDHEEGRGG